MVDSNSAQYNLTVGPDPRKFETGDVHVPRQLALQTIVVVGESLVIESEQMKHRRVEIVERRGILHDLETKVVAGSVAVARLGAYPP